MGEITLIFIHKKSKVIIVRHYILILYVGVLSISQVVQSVNCVTFSSHTRTYREPLSLHSLTLSSLGHCNYRLQTLCSPNTTNASHLPLLFSISLYSWHEKPQIASLCLRLSSLSASDSFMAVREFSLPWLLKR